MRYAGKHTSAELAELFSVARSTVYRAVQRAGEPKPARSSLVSAHVFVDETKQRGSLLVASVVPSDLDSVRRTRRGHHQRIGLGALAVRDQIRSVTKGTPVAGSLVTNQVRAYDLLRTFGRDGHPTPLGQAFAEYGHIAKPLHLLALVDPIDRTYQRRMNRQLTLQESRHRLARKICHGNRGQIRQAYREGQEDQLAALGLVLNAVVLWNTRCLDAIVENLRGSGQPVRDEDVAPLSPLGHAHVNCLGRYAFITQPPAELRPLRAPNARDGEDDDF